MPVDSTEAHYSEHFDMWVDMRNAKDGERSVKAAGTRYLPMLGGHADSPEGKNRYAAYKKRAIFYNATGRTIDSMSGMIFRKPPIVKVPTALESFLTDVTLSGLSFQAFSEQAVDEVITVGRYGILIDLPEMPEGVRTIAEADRANIRPFFSPYEAENIINWKMSRIGNKNMLTQVRLWESVEESTSEFESSLIDQIRVLDLAPVQSQDEETVRLVYRQRLFRRDPSQKNKWIQFGDDIFPTVNNQMIEEIPFIFLGPKDTSPNVSRPPLMDVAEVNFSHYRTVADLEHGAHFTALPTPYAFGIPDEDAPDEIGPETLWHSESENVTVGLLEFTGSGLGTLEERRKSKEEQMAALGARLLAPDKRSVESAETATIHRSGEISVLSSLAQAVSIGLREAVEIVHRWMLPSSEPEVEVMLNRDYLPREMPPQMITALISAVQRGNISQKTFFDNLQRGEIIDAEKTFEEEEQEIEDDNGRGLGLGSDLGGGGFDFG